MCVQARMMRVPAERIVSTMNFYTWHHSEEHSRLLYNMPGGSRSIVFSSLGAGAFVGDIIARYSTVLYTIRPTILLYYDTVCTVQDARRAEWVKEIIRAS